MAHPYKIADEYAGNEVLADAYDRGLNTGHGLACHNVPKLGVELWTEAEGRVVVDAENIREVHESICYEAEELYRCYSPFEPTAAEFNDSDDSEALWEAYDAGAAFAIGADVASYTDEDYGIVGPLS